MRQVVLEEPGRFAMRDAADPQPSPDEALVRVRRIGVCGTDLHAFTGRQPFFSYPRVLGHELAVTVERTPAGDTRVSVGDRCAVRPFLNDPTSRASQRGRVNCCESLRVLGVHIDGGMGDLLAIPSRFLHPVPTLALEELALIEPLSIGCHAVARAGLTPADEVLVIGAGPIGLASAQFAVLSGAAVTVVDLSNRRLELVKRLMPAATTATMPADGARFDCVFDATGSAASMMRAFDVVAAGGRLVFVGLTLDPITFADPDFHRREITLLASRNATPADFDRVIAAVVSRQIEPAAWITHTLSLDDVPARFDEVRRDAALVKAVIHVS
jgi:2-desacetyl-2-hydroxyethyl bacteriochlorophyllide A dehydrogenase